MPHCMAKKKQKRIGGKKQITNKYLMLSTGNSFQYSVMAYMEKESETGKDQRSLQKNWRYQGNSSRMGMVKKRNVKDLTEAQEIKKK